MEAPPPPPPPPHGENAKGGRSGGLPDGKYDIFVIPPSSSGSGFLYLPSLQTQRNSFLAGCACTAAAFFIYSVAVPVIKDWFLNTLNGGGSGVLMLVLGVGVVSWALGKTQGEGSTPGNGSSTSSRGFADPPPHSQPRPEQASSPPPPPPPPPEPESKPQSPPPPKSSWQRPKPSTDGKTAWEKAREETRKREEERKKAEEIKRRREELEKERAKLREKETLERLEREFKAKKEQEAKIAADVAAQKLKEETDRLAQREKERKEREVREKVDRERKAAEAAKASPKRPPMPSVRTEKDDDAYSFRPYDRPKSNIHKSSSGSVYSEDSYAPSATTAKTTPPPSTRGPYHTKDPDKIIIKAVYSFNAAFMRTPIAQLLSGQGNVTDGLILRITTEGLFIDDDVRGVPQREWDVKAWTMKLAESCEFSGLHVLRASIRDQEGKKYVFVLNQSEGWKVAVGLQRLRKGSQVRALGVAGMPQNEAKMILENLGWL